MAFKTTRPAYLITVRNAILAFITKMENNVPTYETEGAEKLIYELPVIKTLGVSPDSSTKKIYASGVVYDVTTQTKGATASLGVVALPGEVEKKALGSVIKGAIAYDRAIQNGMEFSFGYYCEMSDNSLVYYWHPRCKLVLGDSEYDTMDDGDIDPEASYDIEIMPTHEGVWRVRYFTADVADGKVPLTLDDFFGALPYNIADIEALAELEQDAPTEG